MSIREQFWDITGQLMDEGFKGSTFELWKLAMIKCLDDGRYVLAVSYLHAEYDGASGDEYDTLFQLICKRLIQDCKYKELHQLWLTAISIRSTRFFDTILGHYRKNGIPKNKYIVLEQYIESKNNLLNMVQGYCDVLSQMKGTEDKVAAMLELQASIKNDTKPKAKPTSDKRKLDENTFWTLISEAQSNAEFSFEVPEKLQYKLECMNLTAIKKFDKLFRQKVSDLCTWDLWALAYIMRGGCGDDAFEYWRAGLVLQGKEVYELAQNDLVALAEKLKGLDYDVECEQALYIAENAYEGKKGEFMPYQNIDYPDIQGEKWEEEDLPNRYPELCKIFNWAG